MGIYISSKGIKVETSTMDDVYIQRALLKARSNGDDANVKALEDEIEKRKTGQ